MEPADLDVNRHFTEMGLDSIIGVEWIRAVNRALDTDIQAATVYDYPSLREFTDFVERLLASSEPAGSPPADPLGADEILRHVHEGAIDLSWAEQLLRQLELSPTDPC